jgi:DNA polymerase I-like protein with 3'-5' exonuclease and polymerase domains
MGSEYIRAFKESNATLLKGTAESFQKFITGVEYLQLDTETNVTEFHTERELYVVQLGSYDGLEQHIFDIPNLNSWQHEMLKELLMTDTIFIAHNAKFEYMIINKHFGIDVNRFEDTMLASRLITAGLELGSGYNSLSNLVLTAFGTDLSKASQTTFTGEMMSPEQLLYADMDVIYLGKLLTRLKRVLVKWDLMTCFKLENSALRPIGDMSINGIHVDTVALDENIENYDKEAKKQLDIMIEELTTNVTDPVIKAKLSALNVVQERDEAIINWGSSVQKKKLLGILYPNVEFVSTAKGDLKKIAATLPNPIAINKIIAGETEVVNAFLLSRHSDELYKLGFLKRKGDININFDSPSQLLELFKIWHPNITGVGEKVLRPLKSPIVLAYKKYAKISKLVSSFGRKMYTYIESDNKIHSTFNQLVPTGSRMSSSRPEMLGL